MATSHSNKTNKRRENGTTTASVLRSISQEPMEAPQPEVFTRTRLSTVHTWARPHQPVPSAPFNFLARNSRFQRKLSTLTLIMTKLTAHFAAVESRVHPNLSMDLPWTKTFHLPLLASHLIQHFIHLTWHLTSECTGHETWTKRSCNEVNSYWR